MIQSPCCSLKTFFVLLSFFFELNEATSPSCQKSSKYCSWKLTRAETLHKLNSISVPFDILDQDSSLHKWMPMSIPLCHCTSVPLSIHPWSYRMVTIVMYEPLPFRERIATFNTEFWLKKKENKNLYQSVWRPLNFSCCFHFPKKVQTAVLSDSIKPLDRCIIIY